MWMSQNIDVYAILQCHTFVKIAACSIQNKIQNKHPHIESNSLEADVEIIAYLSIWFSPRAKWLQPS